MKLFNIKLPVAHALPKSTGNKPETPKQFKDSKEAVNFANRLAEWELQDEVYKANCSEISTLNNKVYKNYIQEVSNSGELGELICRIKYEYYDNDSIANQAHFIDDLINLAAKAYNEGENH